MVSPNKKVQCVVLAQAGIQAKLTCNACSFFSWVQDESVTWIPDQVRDDVCVAFFISQLAKSTLIIGDIT